MCLFAPSLNTLTIAWLGCIGGMGGVGYWQEWYWVPRFVILGQSLIVLNRENCNVPTTMQGDSHLKVLGGSLLGLLKLPFLSLLCFLSLPSCSACHLLTWSTSTLINYCIKAWSFSPSFTSSLLIPWSKSSTKLSKIFSTFSVSVLRFLTLSEKDFVCGCLI